MEPLKIGQTQKELRSETRAKLKVVSEVVFAGLNEAGLLTDTPSARGVTDGELTLAVAIRSLLSALEESLERDLQEGK